MAFLLSFRRVPEEVYHQFGKRFAAKFLPGAWKALTVCSIFFG